MKRRIRVAAASSLLALGGLGMVACGGGDDDDDEGAATQATTTATTTEEAAVGGGGATEIGMTEYEFDPAHVKVSRGGTITVTNNGQLPHNYSILDVRGVGDVTTGDVDPGSSGELTVDLPPGWYGASCTIHTAQDMGGILTVCADGKCPPKPHG
jgi:plastocyanin